MPQLITYGNELIRFNPSNNHIEVSTSRGSSWFTRYSGSGLGNIRDLLVFGSEILALTDKGLYVSTSKGTSWFCRNSSSSVKGFLSLADGGNEILANTADGHLYVSTSKGTSWFRRR